MQLTCIQCPEEIYENTHTEFMYFIVCMCVGMVLCRCYVYFVMFLKCSYGKKGRTQLVESNEEVLTKANEKRTQSEYNLEDEGKVNGTH